MAKLVFICSVLLVMFLFPCNARLLNEIIIRGNVYNVGVQTATTLTKNRDMATQIFEVPPPQQDEGINGGGNKYEKFRSLVLSALPKGTTKSSGSSKKHNDVKS
ncbi:hypothetical protein vseg_003445 [Gypsophila vaccaria]